LFRSVVFGVEVMSAEVVGGLGNGGLEVLDALVEISAGKGRRDGIESAEIAVRRRVEEVRIELQAAAHHLEDLIFFGEPGGEAPRVGPLAEIGRIPIQRAYAVLADELDGILDLRAGPHLGFELG